MAMLYGDGVRDDTDGIQALLNSGKREIALPEPAVRYTISKTLVLPTGIRLVLPRRAEIRLADGSNCPMLKTATVASHANRLPDWADAPTRHQYAYVDDWAPVVNTRDVELCGGIWNCNNRGQKPNPVKSFDYTPREFSGMGMMFYGVDGLKLSALTVKDPTNYGILLDRVVNFTVEDVQFDYNLGNPMPLTMDGVHVCGNCRNGVIRNLKGAVYDDLVALNADEGSGGPITDVLIDGLFAERCHSAVRMLSVQQPVKRVRVCNVFGTYYQYCVALSKYYPPETTAGFEAIQLDHIFASKAPREVYPFPDSYVFPLFWIEENVRVDGLTLRDVFREEEINPICTLYVGENAVVRRLTLDNVVTVNRTGKPMPLFENRGTVREFSARGLSAGADDLLVNRGVVAFAEGSLS